MEMDKIKAIIQLMKDNDLKIFSLEDGDTELYLETHSKDMGQAVQPNVEVGLKRPAVKPDSLASNIIEVRSNQIGTFYTQPDEDTTDTFVKVGDRVSAGDQIGLIEIMKLFNEVRVEDSGVITEILVANGDPVEYDQVLMLLKAEEE